eukprot:jgi/Chlat1/4278/Chrsp29S04372
MLGGQADGEGALQLCLSDSLKLWLTAIKVLNREPEWIDVATSAQSVPTGHADPTSAGRNPAGLVSPYKHCKPMRAQHTNAMDPTRSIGSGMPAHGLGGVAGVGVVGEGMLKALSRPLAPLLAPMTAERGKVAALPAIGQKRTYSVRSSNGRSSSGNSREKVRVSDGDEDKVDDSDSGKAWSRPGGREVHHVVPRGSGWRLALHRYLPDSEAPKRSHPVVLLPGLASNVITFDVSRETSLARHLAQLGFDTWVCELRGNGLSRRIRDENEPEEVTRERERLAWDETVGRIEQAHQEDQAPGSQALQIWQKPLVSAWQNPIGTARAAWNYTWNNTWGRYSTGFGKTYKAYSELWPFNWDYDSYLLEDLPAQLEYIRDVTRPPDNKVLAVGHSLGGILLYSLLATKGEKAGFAGIVSVASALDYRKGSALELLVPLLTPARVVALPAIPLDTMLRSSATVLGSQAMGNMGLITWLRSHISVRGSMDPGNFERLLMYNFAPVPMALLQQMASVFDPRGLRSRDANLFYNSGLIETKTPVLAIAGGGDSICPPTNVKATVDEHLSEVATYQQFDTIYGHYDLLCGSKAPEEVFPCISEFLMKHDQQAPDNIRDDLQSVDIQSRDGEGIGSR